MKSFLLPLFALAISIFPILEAFSTSNETFRIVDRSMNISSPLAEGLPTLSDQDKGSKLNSVGNNANDISLDILTQYSQYIEQQSIQLYVKVYSEKPGIIKLILEEKNSTGGLVYKTSQIVNVPNYIFYLHPGSPGNYNITVTAIQNGNSEVASTRFNVVGIVETNTARLLFVSFAFFAALLILVCVSRENGIREEILRFLFLSGIVGSILCSFIFTEIEFGKSSPIGLIKIDQNVTDSQTTGKQWVFNIGGALKIPIYVIVFGLIGGYLRYLYKTSRLFIDEELRSERDKVKKYLAEQGLTDVDRRLIFFESLKDIALFFLAPILAVVVWFLFSQWEPIADSPSLLAVFSFASGLVTNEIVSTISNFTKTNLTKRTSSS